MYEKCRLYMQWKLKILMWRNWILEEDEVTTLLVRGGGIFACQLSVSIDIKTTFSVYWCASRVSNLYKQPWLVVKNVTGSSGGLESIIKLRYLAPRYRVTHKEWDFRADWIHIVCSLYLRFSAIVNLSLFRDDWIHIVCSLYLRFSAIVNTCLSLC